MKVLFTLMVVLAIGVSGCQKSDTVQQGVRKDMTKEDVMTREATFAGGCFWCTEADLKNYQAL